MIFSKINQVSVLRFAKVFGQKQTPKKRKLKTSQNLTFETEICRIMHLVKIGRIGNLLEAPLPLGNELIIRFAEVRAKKRKARIKSREK